MRRLIHSWTTWNDGRNKSFKILEKIFGADTNGDGENTTRGVDEYVVTVNDETIKERSSDSEIQILGISVNERHKPKKIRKKRTIYKPVEEPKRVKILKYVLSNKKSLYPEGQKSGGRLTNAAMQAWDKVYELCIR